MKKLIINELKQGIHPNSAAKAIALGALIGISPLIGATTLLSFFVALKLRLNQIIIQAVNYFLYPLQILLIPVYIKICITLIPSISPFGNSEIDLEKMVALFRADARDFLIRFGFIVLMSVGIWLIIAAIFYPILMKLFLSTLNKTMHKTKSNKHNYQDFY